ncbi:sugar phosphate isomerase/epimerase [Micromonospora sp. NBC_01699]|uniref:sugar phosphate isomerase/epimerase family protein n=1 Tax=Micromonospora sp. NBC_01699 TaxID=2975984 RepID=UPI002E2C2B71|nr:sugar phosphate isomerase/epimerase [Micromonospora sp. NBC_01699]
MRFSVFTASTPQWTPSQAANALAAQGWDGIEWRVTDQQPAAEPGFWAGNRATWPLAGLEDHLPEIARITRSAGLDYSGIGGYVPSRERADVERMLAATAALGAGRVRVTMPALRTGRYPELFDTTRRDLDWAAGRAAEYGVSVLVELHHKTIVSSASAAIRLVDGLDPARVGVIHDVGNLVIEGHEDYLAGFEMLGPYLAHVHVKNVAWRPVGQRSDGSTEWAEDWAPLPDGQADLGAYFDALGAVGYDGWVTVEDFSTVQPLAERTRDNLAYLRTLSGQVATG